MKSVTRVLYSLLTLGSLLGGLVCLGFGLLPYPQLKRVGDGLSKDGDLVSFTPGLHANLQLKILFIGIILILVGLFCILRTQLVERTLTQALAAVDRAGHFLFADARRLRQDFIAIKLAAWEWAALAGLTVCGALLRLPFMSHLLEYDEAFTFNEYARFPLRQVVSDYSLPNNHIFHTILVHFSYLLFGNTLFAIRLPVLIGGLCLIPCVYLLTRRFFNRTAALLAAGVVTTYPLLILKSTSARGYILIALLVVIALILGEYLAVRKNHAGWLLWSLCIALGFYTNPSMIYTFAVIFLWMALRMIRAGQVSAYASRRECAIYLVSFSILAAVFTLSFYLPVFFKNGILNFFYGSRVADSLPLGTFLAGLPDVLSEIGDEWRFQLPDGMSLLLVVGFLFAVLFSRRNRRGGAILLIAFPVALGVLLLAQWPISIARMWLWVVSLLIIWAAGGLTQLLAWLTQKSKLPSYAAPVILSAVMLIFLANAVFASSRQARQLTDGVDVEKEVTLYLKTMVNQDDIVIVSDYSDAQYFYYFNTYQIPEIAYRQIKNRPFNRAFVVVYPTYKRETLPKVLTQFGPDYGFPDKSAGKLLTSIGIANVYEIEPNPAIMQKLFGQSTNPSQK